MPLLLGAVEHQVIISIMSNPRDPNKPRRSAFSPSPPRLPLYDAIQAIFGQPGEAAPQNNAAEHDSVRNHNEHMDSQGDQVTDRVEHKMPDPAHPVMNQNIQNSFDQPYDQKVTDAASSSRTDSATYGQQAERSHHTMSEEDHASGALSRQHRVGPTGEPTNAPLENRDLGQVVPATQMGYTASLQSATFADQFFASLNPSLNPQGFPPMFSQPTAFPTSNVHTSALESQFYVGPLPPLRNTASQITSPPLFSVFDSLVPSRLPAISQGAGDDVLDASGPSASGAPATREIVEWSEVEDEKLQALIATTTENWAEVSEVHIAQTLYLPALSAHDAVFRVLQSPNMLRIVYRSLKTPSKAHMPAEKGMWKSRRSQAGVFQRSVHVSGGRRRI